jgi:hypothetical protein
MQVRADEGDVMEPATVPGTPGAQALVTGRLDVLADNVGSFSQERQMTSDSRARRQPA